jgi:SAM-dependent methyltransferase
MRKFGTEDQRYFENRRQFAEKYHDVRLWFVADNWPLFAGRVNIGRFLAIYDLVKKVSDLPGHFCELGCWNGTNLVYLAKIIAILRPHGCTEVIGFDSFRGLGNFDGEKDPSGHENRIYSYRGNVELLQDVLRLYGLEESVQIVEGNILETLPAFLQNRKDIRFAFVYLDADLYAPTRAAVELLYPRLLKGGIMVCDEYNTEDWPGETRAIHEVLGEDVQVLSVPFARQPTAYIIK